MTPVRMVITALGVHRSVCVQKAGATASEDVCVRADMDLAVRKQTAAL